MSHHLDTIAAGVTVLAFIAAVIRWVVPFVRRVGHFLDDWFGESERPGFPGQPGVMERLSRVETNVSELRKSQHATQEEQTAMWLAIKATAEATPPPKDAA